MRSARPVIFSNHGVLHQVFVIPLLDGFEFNLQFVDVLLFSRFHLLQDFFLGIEFTIKVLFVSQWVVNLHLEFPILSGENFNLPISGAELDFFIPDCQNLIFEIAFSFNKFAGSL